MFIRQQNNCISTARIMKLMLLFVDKNWLRFTSMRKSTTCEREHTIVWVYNRDQWLQITIQLQITIEISDYKP